MLIIARTRGVQTVMNGDNNTLVYMIGMERETERSRVVVCMKTADKYKYKYNTTFL